MVWVIALSGCIHPAAKEVTNPRSGRPLGRVCLVYGSDYLVRLGGLEKFHPFDIHKYERIYLALIRDGIICSEDIFVPEVITREDLLRVHDAQYLDHDLKRPSRVAQYLEAAPLSVVPAKLTDLAMLKPFRSATGGTLAAARLALEHGVGINLGGGYHHAEPDRGGGFCIYADIPIAVRALQAEGLIERALIVDVDVHQGNGTALCFENDDAIFTFDIHQAGIYPIPKERNDLDVALPAGTDDAAFLSVLAEHLPRVFEEARSDIVFLQAGVDVLDGDPLAGFTMTIPGVVERDRMIVTAALARGIPIVITLGGGYGARAWEAQFESIKQILEMS